MGTTEYNIDMIMRRTPKESPETIREILNEVQMIVYSQDCRQVTYIDPSTGLPPYLVTTDAVYVYDCPANCRRTAAILTLNPERRYDSQRPAGPRREYFYRGREYYKIAADSRDATISDVAKVYLQDNPGSTTDKYLHLYYLKPTEISDVSIQLTLPEDVHYMLRKGVIALITADEYGDSGYEEQVMKSLARKIRNKLNGGSDGTAGETPIQAEYREYDQIGYGHY